MAVNVELLKKVVNHIIEHPETWGQSAWHCGTAHCVAGHCQIMAGKPPIDATASRDAKEALGISDDDAEYLFAGHRTLSEIHAYAKSLITGDPYSDRNGYNRAGYDRVGYDRAGYNRAGYNRDGYDRAGYNRDGYDRDGYDRDGYDRAGYNLAGYDRDGYDRDGSKLPLL